MQGTVLVLMALSGVGCHHKACDGGYAPMASGCYSGYASGCYASYEPSCYAEPVVMDGCYGGGYGAACYSGGYGGAAWSSCYGDIYDACYSVPACYGGVRKHRHGGLFGCFKRKHCGACNGGYASEACYSGPVFGAYPPVTYGDTVYGASQIYGSGQVYGAGQATYGAAPTMSGSAVTGVAPAGVTPTTDAVPAPTNGEPSLLDRTAPGAAPTPPAPDTNPINDASGAVDRSVQDAAGSANTAVQDAAGAVNNAIPAAPAPEVPAAPAPGR